MTIREEDGIGEVTVVNGGWAYVDDAAGKVGACVTWDDISEATQQRLVELTSEIEEKALEAYWLVMNEQSIALERGIPLDPLTVWSPAQLNTKVKAQGGYCVPSRA